MADHRPDRQANLAVHARASDQTRMIPGTPGIMAIALTLLWLAVCLFLYLWADGSEAGGLSRAVTAMGVLTPVALIWVAALGFGAIRRLEAANAHLHDAVAALRQAHLSQMPTVAQPRHSQPASTAPAVAQAVVQPPVPASQSARPQPARQAPPPRPALPPQTNAEGQTLLALDAPTEAKAATIPTAEMILALNFPDDAEDIAAITALKRALQDRDAAKLIRAAQDVLTLLGQDGVYMDNLQPDRARPEVWRRFAAGERGRGIAALGGIRDRETLAFITAKMRQDPVFRDAAHHFLRSFDRSFSAFAETADDAAISALAETRTARAFMLIGRVMGTFD